MPKYHVEFQQDRKAFFSASVIVEASSLEEAKEKAEKKLDKVEWEHFDDETIDSKITEAYEI